MSKKSWFTKYFRLAMFTIVMCAMVVSPLAPFYVLGNATLPFITQSTEMRGLWVTSAYNLDWPSRQGLTPAEHMTEINDMLHRAANQGINAVFVQVRPAADALYRSDIFPWSHLLTGTQGVAPANNFDPLAYWIQQAHALGIEVHAWINPYRVTFPNQHITNPAQLAANHPARLDPSLVVAYRTSLFFDPGNPAARQLIVDGAAEILRNYNIDGIHLDDYFYPSRTFPDHASFARYGGGMNRYDWRRENVNALIRDLQRVTYEINPNASFGVSPFAIWQNNDRDPRGSATSGMESYYTQFADTRRWVTEGWVDYIVPQIYWIEGNPAACYEVVLSWWEDVVWGTGVRLYIGLAPYREVNRGTDQRFANWREGEIVRQLERNARSPVVRGSIFFRERFMRSDVGNAIGQFYAQHLPGQVPTRRDTTPPNLPEPCAPTEPTPPADPPTEPIPPANYPPPENRPIPQFTAVPTTTDVGVWMEFSTAANNQFGYRIFRATNAIDAGTPITDFPIRVNPAHSLNRIITFDPNVNPNTDYWFYIREVIAVANFDDATQTFTPEVLGSASTRMHVRTSAEITEPTTGRGFILMFIGNTHMNVNNIWEGIDPPFNNTAPIISAGRTMVPVRAVVTAMGGTPGWDSGERRIDLQSHGNHVQMWLGQRNARVNGITKEMDAVPQMVNDRTLIPLRFVAEFLGAQVDWVGAQQMAVIVYDWQ